MRSKVEASCFRGRLVGGRQAAASRGIDDATHATNLDLIRRALPGLPRDDVAMLRIVVVGNLTDRLVAPKQGRDPSHGGR